MVWIYFMSLLYVEIAELVDKNVRRVPLTSCKGPKRLKALPFVTRFFVSFSQKTKDLNWGHGERSICDLVIAYSLLEWMPWQEGISKCRQYASLPHELSSQNDRICSQPSYTEPNIQFRLWDLEKRRSWPPSRVQGTHTPDHSDSVMAINETAVEISRFSHRKRTF
jgi:hypothetical protein